ncbi:MAG: DEAD/DEAH box helicase family protein [Phycisphaerales bacterium]|nr:DEAD/DEAH box helicase family protein [Phycisphaerales bacterium]
MKLRDYQRRVLSELEDYFKLARTHGNEARGARTAFVILTGRNYLDVPGIENLPYVCLRVPTGGGKTPIAAHAVHVVAEKYLQTATPTVLWLAPSNAIVGQTLKALRNRDHWYRRVLDEKFAGNVKVMELGEALSVTRADLTGAACIIATTFQALRVDNTEGRKVYEVNGALQHHFESTGARDRFTDDSGVVTHSLANVLNMHRPLVIMDEAHNARTELSFDTLVRFRPSAIVELTATPQREHNPAKGLFASNILTHVSAAELKAEEMIKLPIRLRTEADWRLVVRDALDTRRQLQEQAVKERANTGEYIRPIILFQAQSVEGDDLNVQKLKQALIDDFQVPEAQIAIHTGKNRGLDGVDVADETCPITCIVTVKALVEGWDCPFAYVLCSVSDVSTPRAVEQVLGRILRLPGAKRKQHDALNAAYAFATSGSLIETARNLRDALVQSAGFQKLEAGDLVIEDTAPPPSLFDTQRIVLTTRPRMTALPVNLVSRVRFDESTSEIVVTGEVTDQEAQAIAGIGDTLMDQQAIVSALGPRVAPAATGVDRSPLRIPGLSIKTDEGWSLFEETHLLEVPWELAECDPSLNETIFPSAGPRGQTGEIDVTASGKVEMSNFVETLHRDLSLFTNEPGWTPPMVTGWMMPRVRQLDVTPSSLRSFVLASIENIMRERHWTIDRIAAEKFRLAESIVNRIGEHRNAKRKESYERFLFASDAQVQTSVERTMNIDPDCYSPNWFYEGGYRFTRHIGRVGELKNDGEEFDCAVHIDSHSKVRRWMRNIDRRPNHSFWLQTSTDRFYPDFLAEIGRGKWLVVEYKGADRWSDDDSREKRRLGELWANRSGGKCAFVMPKGPQMSEIDKAIEGLAHP